MSSFNYNDWLRQTKSGPYQKSLLLESADQKYGVISKTKNHLFAFPDPQGGYTKDELDAWVIKGQDRGEIRKIEWVENRQDAFDGANQTHGIEEDTYPETYIDNLPGGDNPQPEDEQFRENDQLGYGDSIEYVVTGDAFTQGWEAFEQGKAIQDCPFTNRKSQEYAQWVDGWASRSARDEQAQGRGQKPNTAFRLYANPADVNTAIEYYSDAEQNRDVSKLPPEYNVTDEVATTNFDVDLKDKVEDIVMDKFPKYYPELRVDDYKKFSFDPDIPSNTEPVIVKYGYNGWEALPNDLLNYLASNFDIKNRYGYDTDDIQYILSPKN